MNSFQCISGFIQHAIDLSNIINAKQAGQGKAVITCEEQVTNIY